MEQPNPAQGSGRAKNGLATRPKSRDGGKKRPEGMPEYGCFSRPVTHTHAGEESRIEIWSAPGKWCIRVKADRRCFYGAIELAAWTAFIQAIDPEAETVREAVR